MNQPTIGGLTLTECILIFTTVFLVLYDILAGILWGNPGTISITIQRWCERDYKLGVLAGLVFAHIFLSTYRSYH